MTRLLQNPFKNMEVLEQQWSRAWPAAIESWSRFTRICPPTLCLTNDAARSEGLTGSFAMIRLHDQAVIVNLR